MTPRTPLFPRDPQYGDASHGMVAVRRRIGNAIRNAAASAVCYFAEGRAFYDTGPDAFDGPIADVVAMRRPCYDDLRDLLEEPQ